MLLGCHRVYYCSNAANYRYDDSRVMEFILMRLRFSDGPSGESASTPPLFSHVTGFKTTGVVMNVFLLDPVGRLLSGFVWLSTSNTIALYALLDWDKPEYVYIDTGIECVSRPGNKIYGTLCNTVYLRFHRPTGPVSCSNITLLYIAKTVKKHTNTSTPYSCSRRMRSH